MKKQIREKIKDLLKGAITTQNSFNKGMLNQEGIEYIAEELTARILKFISNKYD